MTSKNTPKNYITPNGAERLKNELRQLRDIERPKVVNTVAWAASNGDRSENADYIYGKRKLREIDKRIEYLIKRLSIIEIVDPTRQSTHGASPDAGSKIFFGATVTVEDSSGSKKTYRIVGVDETDVDRYFISWLSPIGKALMNKSVGDTALVQTPVGEEELEIIKVEYIALE